MTNLLKLYKYYDVHSHKEKEYLEDLLVNHLPGGYTARVVRKLKEKGTVAIPGTIRNVKNGNQKDVTIFNAIIEVALQAKQDSEQLKKTLQSAV